MRRARVAAAAVGIGLLAGGALWWVGRPPPPPTHAVVRGDTLWRIARANGVTVADLKRWNGLPGDTIEVGQVLVVGPPGEAAPAAAAPEAPRGRERARKKAPAARLQAGAAAPADGLSLPPAQPCLAGPQDVEGGEEDPEFAASAGLDGGQIRGSLAAFEPTLARCLGPETPAGTLDLELTVACTGRVSAVTVLDEGGLPAELVGCVTDTLRYAGFPAHDMPDGVTFGYPVTISE